MVTADTRRAEPRKVGVRIELSSGFCGGTDGEGTGKTGVGTCVEPEAREESLEKRCFAAKAAPNIPPLSVTANER